MLRSELQVTSSFYYLTLMTISYIDWLHSLLSHGLYFTKGESTPFLCRGRLQHLGITLYNPLLFFADGLYGRRAILSFASEMHSTDGVGSSWGLSLRGRSMKLRRYREAAGYLTEHTHIL